MKKLLILIVAVASLWSGYWFIGASGVKSGFTNWFEARRLDGWQADYSDLAVKGFPNRFDTTLTDPALADPNTGLAWSAPFVQIFALSYKPNHIIAAFPEWQTLASPFAKLSLQSEDMRASMVMEPNTALAFNRANLAAGALTITAEDGARTKLSGLQVALTRESGADYRAAFNADGLAPPLPARITGDLPDTLSTFRADATLGFTKAWDITALEEGRPQPTSLKLHLAEAEWGKLKLAAAGDLTIDSAGTPTGTLTLKARNWREILTLAKAAGVLPESLADQVEQGLTLLAGLSGNVETLDIPLGFSGGFIKLGPVPIAPAPRIFIR
ncbi:DUF2125 domain-containing protein [Lentibacter sp. XHP0401]|uniref:DUF2125 domain-containing protein n=1 Tax=Lentibacter sp. XHP0401 TaxID=2984334 RepID=UPI0021E94CA3|nr:DUF2125 domain-containing protein [Lentibacter sp. XHP0401]MCV2893071.1 DUF2125 domain-containing protein [Lentibacter sp. XHP0401]